MNLFEALHRLLSCSHPLILRHPDEYYPFFRGTCFTVCYDGKLFVLSAFHCFEKVDVRATRIDCGGRENEHFPLKCWSYFENPGFIDSDLRDMAIFEVDMGRMTDAEICRAPRLDLADNFVAASQLPKRCDLILEGFPYELAEFSPEFHVTIRPSCKLLGIYEGPTERLGISKLSIPEFGNLGDLNGMSGSPVLAVRQSLDHELKYCLAGMLIQGSVAGKCGYFIQADVLIKALKRCVQNC